LHSSENEKMSTSTEKRIRLQAAVVETLIDHAAEIGQVPEFILEKIPSMLGVDVFQSTPSLWGHEDSENESPSECKRRRHRSVGVLSSVTPVVLTPSTKRKLPTDCSQGLSSKKRRSFKHSFAFEFLPMTILSSYKYNFVPVVQFEASPCVCLESSQTSLSPSTMGESHVSSTGNRRSKRLASKKLYRAESGKTGCFSPKISRKEMVRRSLRLKFGLGKSNREMNIVSGCAAGNRSENIGRRLASQQVKSHLYANGFLEKRMGLEQACCVSSSRNISKSEENLLTPKCHNKVVHRMSWNSPAVTDSQVISKNEQILPGHSEMGVSSSESVLIFGKPPVIPDELKSASVSKQGNNLELVLCEDASNSTTETLLKVKQAFSASGNILHNLIGDKKSSLSVVASEILTEIPCPSGLSSAKELLVEEVSENVANVQSRELLHQFNQSSAADKEQSKKEEIDILEKRNFKTSIEVELQVPKPDIKKVKELPRPQLLAKENKFTVENSSTKDDLHKSEFSGRKEEIELIHSQTAENCMVKCCNLEQGTAKPSLAGQLPTSQLPKSQNEMSNQYLKAENLDKVLNKTSTVSDQGKVSDHIQWFNQLSLNDPNSASKTKPPLKFQRTPVRQSVRRINSLLEANRQSVSFQTVKLSGVGSPLVKSLSYDSALFPCTEKPSKNSMLLPRRSESTRGRVSVAHKQLDLASKSCCRPLNPSDKPDVSVRAVGIREQKAAVHPSKSVLEDLTNHEMVKSNLKVNANINVPGAAPEKSMIARSASGKERVRYRGSPKNPISEVKLLPTAKPVDL
ncbi:RHGBA protein, partial [Chloropsis cyanopogon]|nr:RHGBA protein [Chloropsis cyanopogon]